MKHIVEIRNVLFFTTPHNLVPQRFFLEFVLPLLKFLARSLRRKH